MEDPGDPEFREITEANFKKLSSTLTKTGYKDGIVEGREAVFQHGFDVGYSDGLRTALEISTWKTIRELDAKADEQKLHVEHSVLDAPEKDHHQFIKNSQATADEASKLQNEYIDKIKASFKTDLKHLNQYFEEKPRVSHP